MKFELFERYKETYTRPRAGDESSPLICIGKNQGKQFCGMSSSPGDSLLFDAIALHGIEAIQNGPVSYLSVVFTLRE